MNNMSSISVEGSKVKAFARAATYLLQWKVRLRKFISGKSDFRRGESDLPEEHKFIKWLSSDEITKYVSDHQIREFEKLYGEMLFTSNRICELKSSGDDIAARQEFENMQAPSMKLISLLTILPKKRIN